VGPSRLGKLGHALSMDSLRRVLILAPMTSELRPLRRYTKARRTKLGDLTVFRAESPQLEVTLARAGVGPVSAQSVTQRALSHLEFDHVVVSGIAGGLDPHLPVGTVVVPEAVLDLRTGRRYRSSPIEGVQLSGLVATADQLITDEAKLAEILATGVAAMEMESSGVAAACEAAGVPWTTFRVVSDRPDEGLTDDAVMSLLRPDGSPDVIAALGLVAKHPSRIPSMMRLARDSTVAASKAARTALTALGWTHSGPARGTRG
jgi:adenosylhomocysteine nucleosidase